MPDRTIAIIPARLDSTRLPRKVLLPIEDKSLVQHVHDNIASATLVDEVYVATDSGEVRDAVLAFGGKVLMTPSAGIASGSDRVAHAARQVPHDIVVNVQADEPFMSGKMVDEVVRPMLADAGIEACTLCRRITKEEEFDDPGVVKCVRDARGFGLYFSRHRIPYPRNPGPDYVLHEHLGVYGFRTAFLQQFVQWDPAPLELTESLEMLRIIEHGVPLKVVETIEDTSYYLSVDTMEDLQRAAAYRREILKKGGYP